jgi:hypothetical protein
MTETELTDQLREQFILNGPDAWQSGDYLYRASQLGLTDDDARKRALTIRDDVLANGLLLEQIRARIARLIEPSRIHLYEQDLSKIINAAGSLGLSADFVRTRWIPFEKARLAPVTPIPAAPIDSVPQVPQVPDSTAEYEKVQAVVASPIVEIPLNVDSLDVGSSAIEPPKIESPVPIIVSEPAASRPERVVPPEPVPMFRPEPSPGPPPVVRSFTATPARVRKGQPVTIDWDVANVLAVTIDDLGEGLSPKNRGWVKPTKSTDYTLFDANNNPLSTVRVDVVQPDRSGLYGILFALALLAVIYWFIRSTNNRQPQEREKSRQEKKTERSSDRSDVMKESPVMNEPAMARVDTIPAPATDVSVATEAVKDKPTAVPEQATEPPADTRTAQNDNTPTTPVDARQGRYEEAFGDNRFDKVELGTDDRGWRRARKNGRWGYIDSENNWVIQPRFEAVTPFRNDVASAFLDGQMLKIDRSGEPVQP